MWSLNLLHFIKVFYRARIISRLLWLLLRLNVHPLAWRLASQILQVVKVFIVSILWFLLLLLLLTLCPLGIVGPLNFFLALSSLSWTPTFSPFHNSVLAKNIGYYETNNDYYQRDKDGSGNFTTIALCFRLWLGPRWVGLEVPGVLAQFVGNSLLERIRWMNYASARVTFICLEVSCSSVFLARNTLIIFKFGIERTEILNLNALLSNVEGKVPVKIQRD